MSDGDGGVVATEQGRQGRIDERLRFGVEGGRRCLIIFTLVIDQ